MTPEVQRQIRAAIARVRTAVSEHRVATAGQAAEMLDRDLPAGVAGVPGGLRYAIARARHQVLAPPFASVEEFLRTIARFEPVVTPAAVTEWPARPEPAVIPSVVAEPSVGLEASAARSRRLERIAAVAAVLFAAFAIGAVAPGLIGRIPHRAPGRQTIEPSSATRTQPPAAARASAATPRTAPSAPAPTPSNPPAPHGDEKPAVVATKGTSESTVVRAIDQTDAAAFSPAFSSNGTAIFFHTGSSDDDRSALAVAGTAGSDLGVMKIVDDGARNYHVQPSPDGRMIAFDSDRDGIRGVYVADRDGTHVRRISGDGYAAVPTWSPDGARLAYIRGEADNPNVWNLWLQPVEGGAATRITHYPYGQTWSASWFPDNHRICYTHETTLVILDLYGGTPRTFDSPLKGRLVRTPAVSPDGSKVIFQVSRSGAWLLAVADGTMERVLPDPTAEEFAWAPDGRRVAFHSRRDGQWGIYVLTRG